MNKQEFLSELRKGLSIFTQEEIEERLTFYSEMIDDKVEDGLSQEEAVSEIGETSAIVSQIIADIPLTKLVKEKIKPKRRLSVWEIILLVLGSPIWLSVLIAVFAVIISIYISLWAVLALLIGCAIGGLIGGLGFAVSGNGLTGAAVLGTDIVCVGTSVFMFYGCKMATKGIIILTKKIVLGIKNRIIKKEEA